MYDALYVINMWSVRQNSAYLREPDFCYWQNTEFWQSASAQYFHICNHQRGVCVPMVWAVRRIQLKMEHELTSEHHIKAMRQKVAKIKARPAAAAVAAAAAAVSLPAACPVLIIFNCSYFGVKSNHGSASAGRRVRLPAFRLTAARFRCVTQKIWRTARMQKEMHPR